MLRCFLFEIASGLFNVYYALIAGYRVSMGLSCRSVVEYGADEDLVVGHVFTVDKGY